MNLQRIREWAYHRWFWWLVLRPKIKREYWDVERLAYWFGWYTLTRQPAPATSYVAKLVQVRLDMEAELLKSFPAYQSRILRYGHTLRRRSWLRGVRDALRNRPRRERREILRQVECRYGSRCRTLSWGGEPR